MFSEWYAYGFIMLARLFQDHQRSSRFLIWITLRWVKVLFVNFDELKVTATMSTFVLKKKKMNVGKWLFTKLDFLQNSLIFTWPYYVGVQKISEKSRLRIWFYYYDKIWGTFCHCLVHQHSCFITWVKTKIFYWLICSFNTENVLVI